MNQFVWWISTYFAISPQETIFLILNYHFLSIFEAKLYTFWDSFLPRKSM